MHEDDCGCEHCHEYSDEEVATALQKLFDALSFLWDRDVDLSQAEHDELEFAQVISLDAGLPFPLPAVMFEVPSRLRKLKAAYSCGYLIDNTVREVACSLLENMRKHWTTEKQET